MEIMFKKILMVCELFETKGLLLKLANNLSLKLKKKEKETALF